MVDVAKLAGVSHQTVSRVLNDHPHVSAKTRAGVLAAIRDLGYRPNAAARTLATGYTGARPIVAETILALPLRISLRRSASGPSTRTPQAASMASAALVW